MKHWYVCKIIGDGLTPETAYRSAIQDVTAPGQGGTKAFNVTTVMPPADPSGAPSLPFCLSVAAGPNHALVNGNADIDPLFTPEVRLVQIGALQAAARIQVFQRLQARGIDTSRFAMSDAVRDVADRIGKDLQPTFSIDAFDVVE